MLLLIAFQMELRSLTNEEIDEFLRGDPDGSALASSGIDRAARLPFSRILSPDDITIGTRHSLRTLPSPGVSGILFD